MRYYDEYKRRQELTNDKQKNVKKKDVMATADEEFQDMFQIHNPAEPEEAKVH